jgi:hypothetical protein
MATRYQADTLERSASPMITTWDMLAIMIILTVSTTLVITTAIANAKLTRRVEYLQVQLNRHER